MRNTLFVAFILAAYTICGQADSTKLSGVQDSLILVTEEDSLRQLLANPDSTQTSQLKSDTLKQAVPPSDNKAIQEPEIIPAKTSSPKDSLKRKQPQIKNYKKYAAIRMSNDSIKYALLDSLSYDELLEYYQTEPDPLNSPGGNTAGDSLYNVLNPLTIPTQTVYGEPLLREFKEPEPIDTSISAAIHAMRPKIGFGMGMIGFHGEMASKTFRSPVKGRPAFDLAISQRLTRYLQLDFSFLFGKFGASNTMQGRNENMQTELRSGGVNLLYDFGNFIPDAYRVRPFVSFGAYGFEFLSKTDLKDKNGNYYHYWSDGSIKDVAEGSPESHLANNLIRDYSFESDIREQNKDGFGKYRESAWAFPIGAGVVMKISDRVDLKFNYQYFVTTTDYIDGISDESLGIRKGNKSNDNYSYLSVSLQYDLIAKKPKRKAAVKDTIDYNDPYLMALFYADSDNDSIIDIDDKCPGTLEGVRVDLLGCPLDGDGDGVPDFRDDELTTPQGIAVNDKGVGLTDEYWQNWYDQYMNDSIAGEKTTEYTGNIYATSKHKSDKKDPYTVELVRYNGAIPSDELAFLLSIGDIISTTLEDGSTVVYTSGNYEKLGAAIKRRDEFREEGNKKAGVSMFKGRDVVQLPEDELESLLKSEIEDLLKLNIGDSIVETSSNIDESFGRNEIVYRVQLGAFRNKISTSVFGANTGVLELKTGENVYRYVTKGYLTIEEAAATRADLVVQGYSDAFVTAYRGGRRIPMSETKATVDSDYKEDLSEDKAFNSIDKTLLSFKIQLGPLKKRAQEAAMDEKVKVLEDSQKQTTASGSIRYTSGNFPGLELAEEYRKTLEEKGFNDAFIIATFKGEIISMQEAMELLK